MRTIAVIAALALAGCGVDGAPERPEKGEPGPFSVDATGTVEIGVTDGSS